MDVILGLSTISFSALCGAAACLAVYMLPGGSTGTAMAGVNANYIYYFGVAFVCSYVLNDYAGVPRMINLIASPTASYFLAGLLISL